MTGQDLTVRPIADGEETAVIALWRACGLTRPWNDPATDLAFARGKANSDVLVGLAGGRIVASAMVGHDGHRGTMYYVSVDPAWQKRGLGAALVAAAEAWLEARGVWKVNLLVRRGNEGALGFYAGQGYETGSSVQIEKWIDPSKKGGSRE
jgi:ribosomal protein S18 acetylase RimI-like enzyme